jgi:uncharacterized protein (TIGR03066 family)
MSIVRWLAVGVIVCVLGAGARADDKTDYAKMMVGKWEASETDPGTIPAGAVVEFTKDGKMKFTGKKDDVEMSFEGTYKVEKNTFTMTVKVGEQEHTQTITITKISDTEMSTQDKDGKKVVLKKKK